MAEETAEDTYGTRQREYFSSLSREELDKLFEIEGLDLSGVSEEMRLEMALDVLEVPDETPDSLSNLPTRMSDFPSDLPGLSEIPEEDRQAILGILAKSKQVRIPDAVPEVPEETLVLEGAGPEPDPVPDVPDVSAEEVQMLGDLVDVKPDPERNAVQESGTHGLGWSQKKFSFPEETAGKVQKTRKGPKAPVGYTSITVSLPKEDADFLRSLGKDEGGRYRNTTGPMRHIVESLRRERYYFGEVGDLGSSSQEMEDCLTGFEASLEYGRRMRDLHLRETAVWRSLVSFLLGAMGLHIALEDSLEKSDPGLVSKISQFRAFYSDLPEETRNGFIQKAWMGSLGHLFHLRDFQFLVSPDSAGLAAGLTPQELSRLESMPSLSVVRLASQALAGDPASIRKLAGLKILMESERWKGASGDETENQVSDEVLESKQH